MFADFYADIRGSFTTGDARGNEGNRITLDAINKNISLTNSNGVSVFILDFDTNTAVSRRSQMKIRDVTGSSSQNIEAELLITPNKISLMNYTGVGIFEVDTGGSSLRVYMKLPTTNVWGVGSLWRDSQGYVRIG